MDEPKQEDEELGIGFWICPVCGKQWLDYNMAVKCHKRCDGDKMSEV